MPVQAPQWSEYLSCPVCQNEFEVNKRPPVSLGCGHTICRTCLDNLQRRQCPFDQTAISCDLALLPVNTALLQLIGPGPVADHHRQLPPGLSGQARQSYPAAVACVEALALFLKPSQSGQLSRPMQRKLVTLLNCQLLEAEGRARAVRAARSLGERSVTELLLAHQNPHQLSANLWAAVRARGCQFLGPAMQEEVLKLVLLALEEGSALSRKVLVMYVVQKLEPHFPQASKTSIGHVVQLLYRASCFKVTKRDGDSSLMELKEEFRTYESLRREHDTQIVQIATEAGLRIAPDQWSSLLYGDTQHKSHMQSIIDKLQTPQSFGQGVQELVIALQRTGDPGQLGRLRPQLDTLTSIELAPAAGTEETPAADSWQLVVAGLGAARAVVAGLVSFTQLSGGGRGSRQGEGPSHGHQGARYKTSLCRDLAQHGSCPRGHNCTFAHTQAELELHRRQQGAPAGRPAAGHQLPAARPAAARHHSGQPSPSPVPSLKVSPAPPPRPRQQPPPPEAAEGRPAAGVVPQQLPVAQVAPTPRVMAREQLPAPGQQYTVLVDQHGQPMLDPATGQQLVAAPMQTMFQTGGAVQLASPGHEVFAVQPAAPIHMATLQVAPAMMVAPPQQLVVQPQQQQQQPQQQQQRDIKHDLSPEIASKSLSALRDRKEEILVELGDIVGESGAVMIGDLARQQAVVEEAAILVDTSAEEPGSRRNSIQQQQQQLSPRQQQQQQCAADPKQLGPADHHQLSATSSSSSTVFSMWTSKPLVTINTLYSDPGGQDTRDPEPGLEDLPDGICVSKFGPISRAVQMQQSPLSPGLGARPGTGEPRAVTANMTSGPQMTSSVRQPLASASPLPRDSGLFIQQDQHSVLNYDPGWYSDVYPIQEGMDSVSMSHLTHPPLPPANTGDQLQHPGSLSCIRQLAESARIHKELADLQRRIESLNVTESGQAMKRDRLAFELRYSARASVQPDTDHDNLKAV